MLFLRHDRQSNTHRADSVSRSSGRPRSLAIAVLVAAFAGGIGAASSASSIGADASMGGVGPVADWLDPLGGELEETGGELEDAMVEVGFSDGPLPMPKRVKVQMYLADAEARIDRILDPTTAPSLDPGDAGAVDESVQPENLRDYAATVVGLLNEALAEFYLGGPGADAEVIGSRLKTVKALLEDYRAAAGI